MIKLILLILIITVVQSKYIEDIVTDMVVPGKQTVISGDIKFNIVINQTSGSSETFYPCSKCKNLYLDKGINGFKILPESLSGIRYHKGPVSLPYFTGSQMWNKGDEDTCSATFSCPPGSLATVQYPIIFTHAPSPAPEIYLVCQETGPDAGSWYHLFSPDTTVQLAGVTCLGSSDTEEEEEEDVDPSYGCNNCPRIYDENCFGESFSCLSETSANMTYQLGPLDGFSHTNWDTCSTTFKCPDSTEMRIQYSNRAENGPVELVTTCDEYLGFWYVASQDPASEIFSIVSVSCEIV